MYEFVSVLSNSINTVERLRTINKNIEDAEFNSLLADLSLELSKTKMELSALIDQMVDIKQENALLKAQSDQKKSVTYFDKLVFENDINGIPKGSPYCGSCHKKDANLYSFKQNTKNPFSSCVNCGSEVYHSDANLVMNPDVFAELKDKHPQHFS